jgi:serine/threonine protein kinase
LATELKVNNYFNNMDTIFSEMHRLKALCAENDHPNIVKFYEYLLFSNIWLIYDYCEEGEATLESRLQSVKQNRHRLDEILIIEWLIQLAAAIDFLHSNSVIHKDIRPENIFFDKTNLKLGQFGFDKIMKRNIKESDANGTFSFFYTSPEMIQMKYYDDRTDLWSIGCLIYEMFTLEKPFRTIDRIVRADVPQLNNFNQHLTQIYYL